MVEWRELHLPEVHWAPRGLPGALKALPGWVARVASESRFAGEIIDFEKALPRGSRRQTAIRRQVLVVPGFGFGDAATLPMQIAVKRAGFRVVRSHIVANVRCSDRAVDRLAEVARRAVDADHGQRLLVVGHSRGGMLARGLGARHPELVSTVVSLGAPLNDEFAFYEIPQPMVGVLKVVHQRDPELRERRCVTRDCTCPYMLATHRPFPDDVELISYYTTSDGIVDWRACVVPGAENIEVPGSHLGMGLRPDTVDTVVERMIASAGRF
ncbi:MAG: alpha/beta fold hydrolase [Candidatus Nanopelagicales bacterium]